MNAKVQIIVSENAPPSIGRNGLDPKIFEALTLKIPDLVNLHPQRGSDRVIKSISPGIVDARDPHIKRILDALKAVGVDIFNATAVSATPFIELRIREYEKSDLDQCIYSVLSCDKFIGEATDTNDCDERGIPHLKAALRPYDREFGRVAYAQACPVLVVRGKVKNALENSGLLSSL